MGGHSIATVRTPGSPSFRRTPGSRSALGGDPAPPSIGAPFFRPERQSSYGRAAEPYRGDAGACDCRRPFAVGSVTARRERTLGTRERRRGDAAARRPSRTNAVRLARASPRNGCAGAPCLAFRRGIHGHRAQCRHGEKSAPDRTAASRRRCGDDLLATRPRLASRSSGYAAPRGWARAPSNRRPRASDRLTIAHELTSSPSRTHRSGVRPVADASPVAARAERGIPAMQRRLASRAASLSRRHARGAIRIARVLRPSGNIATAPGPAPRRRARPPPTVGLRTGFRQRSIDSSNPGRGIERRVTRRDRASSPHSSTGRGLPT